MDKFIVTIECTDPHTLGALIARGLESQAKITNIETAKIPTATIKPEPEPADDVLKSKLVSLRQKKVTRQIDGYKMYRFAVQLYHPQKTFKAVDLRDQWRAWGREASDNAASAHLHRFAKMGLVSRVGGNQRTGFVYQLNRTVTRAEFERLTSNYGTMKERSANGR